MVNKPLVILITLSVFYLKHSYQLPTESQVSVRPGQAFDPSREYPDVLPADCGHYVQSRIVGGQNASLMEFPWMALLAYQKLNEPEFLCAGTLISKRYVLTGGTCVSAKKPTFVRLGEHTIGQERDCNANDHTDCAPPVQDRDIDYIVRHQGYDSRSKQNDIALIRLKEEVTFADHIKPICLPVTAELRSQNPTQYIVTGWGRSELFGGLTHTLQKATVPAVPDRAECQREFTGPRRIILSDGHLCAGERDGADTCNGDSGGPLGYPAQLNGIRFVQYGVTSFGRLCTQGPSVYTNVAHYMDWIVANMEP